jgi:hypothetical protein
MTVPHSSTVAGSDGRQVAATGGTVSVVVLAPPPQADKTSVIISNATDIHIVPLVAPPGMRLFEIFMRISISELHSLRGYNAVAADRLTVGNEPVINEAKFGVLK